MPAARVEFVRVRELARDAARARERVPLRGVGWRVFKEVVQYDIVELEALGLPRRQHQRVFAHFGRQRLAHLVRPHDDALVRAERDSFVAAARNDVAHLRERVVFQQHRSLPIEVRPLAASFSGRRGAQLEVRFEDLEARVRRVHHAVVAPVVDEKLLQALFLDRFVAGRLLLLTQVAQELAHVLEPETDGCNRLGAVAANEQPVRVLEHRKEQRQRRH
mmetsp:Transcript_16771/g.50849  ORF Transcript_16771/g.50849 Transcript_16771/m.50849 type:complete len:219 (-) Transcript_16771:44-700(-)